MGNNVEEKFELTVNGRKLTVQPETDYLNAFYRVFENGEYLFLLSMDDDGDWGVSPSDKDADVYFAEKVGRTIEREEK